MFFRSEKPGPPWPKRLVVLAALLAALAAGPAHAKWLPTDLPYGDFLSRPVSALAPAGPSDLWAVSTYSYEAGDRDHVRWNSLAYRSLNDARLWDLPWDAPTGADAPNAQPFQDVQLYASAFVDRDTGWLFGWQRPTFGKNDPPGPYAFYHTMDRGRSWSIATLPNTEAAAPEDPDFSMGAMDSTHALAAQGHHVFETADGRTWRERTGKYPRLFSLQARGLPLPRVAGTDGGKAVAGTLTANGFVSDLTTDGAFHATRFADALHGWVAGVSAAGEGIIYATPDGGRSWARQLSLPGVTFRGIAVADTDRAWAVGERAGAIDRGVIYGTTDGGKSWALARATPRPLCSVAFRDAYHGWASGQDGVYRFVPDGPVRPGDIDNSGQTDRTDVAAALARAGGLRVTGADDLAASGASTLTLASSVAVLRRALATDPVQTDGARALIVYNAASPDGDGDGVGDSEEVARYYALRRGVPDDQLVPIRWASPDSFSGADTPENPRANWTNAFHAIVEPLRARLAALGQSSVDTVVFTFGVPYAFQVTSPDGTSELVTLDQAVQDPTACDAENWISENPYGAPFGSLSARYGRDRIGVGGRPLGQPVADSQGKISRGPYLLVGRIDGPGPDACEAMIDNALFAEAHYGPGGYDGTAYIDTRAAVENAPTLAPYDLDTLRAFSPVYDSYMTYDRSIARTLLTFHDRGLPWRDEVTNLSIGAPPSEGVPLFRDGTPATSAARAMFYAGWYNYGRYYDVFDWLPGSVGLDFDSASAAYFRECRYFGGSALSAGLTALVGVIQEPYNYHPKPDALMEYLARGFTLGEAAALATDTPRLARAVVLGDPLYRPFGAGPARPVPVPSLKLAASRGAGGWTVTLDTDIPVRASLQYAAGTDPLPDSPRSAGVPRFYALHHAFAVPMTGPVRVLVHATDPTGRVTDSAVVPLG